MADLSGGQRERAPRGVERGLGEDDNPVALGDHRLGGIEHAARARDGDREVGRGVAQGEEDHPGAGTPAELGHLALDPDGTEAVDPARDGLRHRADGGWLLG